jgi:hypothetical protein
MSEVGLYKIEVKVDDQIIVFVEQGYRSFTDKLEKPNPYPRMRVVDENGVIWSFRPQDIKYVRISHVGEDTFEPTEELNG